MPLLPYFLCKVRECGFYTQPILLPFYDPLKTLHDERAWPSDAWRAYIACPGCGQMSVRTRKDIGWANDEWNERYTQKWTVARFRCANPGCQTAMQLYVRMPIDVTPAQLVHYLNSDRIFGRMECGHQYRGLPDGAGLFGVSTEILTYTSDGLSR